MGSRHFGVDARGARPIQNERDYRAAKALLAREMRHSHSDEAWARLEALMQELAEYEGRFAAAEEAAAEAGEEWLIDPATISGYEGPRRRWTDPTESGE